ncbi:MAG: hypothetical protein B6D72_16950 [gamma proteobacterium symbiont of Ctena orbiculata]|nr:MAG: hypothetical protein B6D72_16950 [gamma proteobacterium symbiont of Ctena orbiculata]
MEDVGQKQFTLPAAKGVLAARLSMKPETFSRILQNLSSKNILKTKSNEIEVLDETLLRSLAHLESIYGLEPEKPCAINGQNISIDLN